MTVVDVCVIRTGAESVDTDWMMHAINAAGFREEVAKYESGSTRKRISRKNLAKIKLPVPPLAEQRRIVEKIEELFSDLDAGVEALEAVRRQLDRYRQAVLKAAVEGDLTREWREQHGADVEPASVLLGRILEERRARWEAAQRAKYEAKGKKPPKGWQSRYTEPEAPEADDLPELPEGWVWTSMGMISWDSGYGTSAKCRYENSGPPVLRIPNIKDGGIDLADMKFASDGGAVGSLAPLAANDLLVIRTNGSEDLIGRVGLVEKDLTVPHYFASYLIRFRLCHTLSAAWVRIYWKAPVLREVIVSEAASSAGQYNISQSGISRFVVPLPPLAEQEAIVEEVERRLSVVAAVAAEVDAQLARAGRLRQAILQHAFAGKLVPQDPADEPAEVLLARIREAKQQAPKPPKRRTPAPRQGELDFRVIDRPPGL